MRARKEVEHAPMNVSLNLMGSARFRTPEPQPEYGEDPTGEGIPHVRMPMGGRGPHG